MASVKVCSVDGCGRPHNAKGFCSMHYLRMLNHGSTDKPQRSKPMPRIVREQPCPKCGINDWRQIGVGFRCRECARIAARASHAAKPKNPPIRFDRYGGKGKVYREVERRRRERYDAQDGRCAICRDVVAWDRTCLDHDHECCPGKPQSGLCGKCWRGVLCNPCNTALGMFRDDVSRLRNAIAYLAEYAREV